MKGDQLNKRSRALLEELEALITNGRAHEILDNGWLHDGQLKMPTLDLIRYLGFRMLESFQLKIDASKMIRSDLISKLLVYLKKESGESRRSSIPQTLQRLDCFKYFNAGKKGSSDPYAHEWLSIISPFLYPTAPKKDPNAIAISAGERIIARGLLETMVLRSIFTSDHKRLQSLSAAVKAIRFNKEVKPTVTNRIKAEVLRSAPYLHERLGRFPSRAEIKLFIEQLTAWSGEDPLPVRRNPWKEAFGIINDVASSRTVRLDEDLIVKLARDASKCTG
jgi:hypothetical protein